MPSAAKRSAIARPMPLAAPVISAALPARSCTVTSSGCEDAAGPTVTPAMMSDGE